MIGAAAPIREECGRAFAAFLEREGEAERQAAYALGRRTLNEHGSILALVTALSEVIAEDADQVQDPARARRTAAAAGEFLLECLSPFEMALRGAWESNEALRRQNERQEEEIRRLAHEIHDSAGQLLASVHIELHQLAIAPGGKSRLSRIYELLDRIEDDLRRIAHELRPTILDDLGLLPALRFLGEGVTRRTGLRVSVEGADGRLPQNVETALYRIVQEALTNAARHARASRVEVRLERERGEFRCVVADDGVGFAKTKTEGAASRSGLGLIGIRERLASLGGTLTCGTGERGSGAVLVAAIPLERIHGTASSAG